MKVKIARAFTFVTVVILVALLSPACETIPIGNDQSDGGKDGSAPASLNCTADQDCVTFIDYCPVICGQCVARAAPPPASRCQPPPNVSCMDACAMMHPVCRTGQCVLQ
jgi:hypothetical protein